MVVQNVEFRKRILDVNYRCQGTHLGSALSVIDLIVAAEPGNKGEFVLSCGHKGLALYVYLYVRGMISEEDLYSYCQSGSVYEIHPNIGIPTVRVSMGSLGMGLPVAVGLAVAKPRERVVCMISDGELYEGSTYESLRFAGRQGLGNLRVFLDNNRQTALGTGDVLVGIQKVVEGFGWFYRELDGHDTNVVRAALNGDCAGNLPIFFDASTRFGYPFDWLGLKSRVDGLTEARLKSALEELDAKSISV